MASLSQRVVDSLAKSQADYAARLAAGTQPLPPPALTRVLPFLDYTNTQALVAVNVAYLLVIGALYVWMQSSEHKFVLRGTMMMYNAACVGLAAYVVVGAPPAPLPLPLRRNRPYSSSRVAQYQLSPGNLFVCNKPDFTPAGRRLSHVVWVYYAQKFLEYGDTLFFVLRKSFRQLTALHLYHHVSITVVTALFLRYDVNGDDYLAALANSSVHVLMYLHYLLAAVQVDTWWRRYLTQLQLVQFTLVLGQTVYALAVGGPACGSPDWLKAVMIGYQLSMLGLFGLFYVAQYSGGARAKKGGAAADKRGVRARKLE